MRKIDRIFIHCFYNGGETEKIRFVLKIHHFVLRLSNISFCGLYIVLCKSCTSKKQRNGCNK